MSFYEVLFPVGISYGSAGGPSFSTTIVGLDTGAEQRVSRWSKARRKFDISYGIKTYTDLQTVLAFYMSVKGAAFGFRYKDWTDYTTANDGRSAYDDQDFALATNSTGGTVAENFTAQLAKRYQIAQIDSLGDTTVVIRNLTKPVKDKVSVAILKPDMTWLTGGAVPAWSVNYQTGLITFSGAIEDGWTVYGGCEFDVPVRFTKEMDDLLSVSADSFDSGSVDAIELIEIVDHGEHLDEFYYGGSSVLVFTANITIAASQGKVLVLQPDTNGHDVILPDPWSLSSGGPYYYLINDSAFTIDLVDARGAGIGGIGHSGTSVALAHTIPATGTGKTVTMWINEFTDRSKQWWVWSSSQ